MILKKKKNKPKKTKLKNPESILRNVSIQGYTADYYHSREISQDGVIVSFKNRLKPQ